MLDVYQVIIFLQIWHALVLKQSSFLKVFMFLLLSTFNIFKFIFANPSSMGYFLLQESTRAFNLSKGSFCPHRHFE
jgi:hypothetical protein